MFIRSQDNTKIVVVKHIDSILLTLQNERYFIYSYNGSSETSCNLGNYKTEEEAIKVLDDICNKYQYLKECETTGIVLDNPEYVYYMPDSGGEMA